MSLKKLGRYDIVKPIGKGAMGLVYEAHDPNINRAVAIKTIRVDQLSEEMAAEYESRFRSETQAGGRLQHPNIIGVYDAGRDQGLAYIVMELVRGGDLREQLDQGRRLTFDRSMVIMKELLSALSFAHEQGIIHRDVKPANVMLDSNGRVKLGDFGVARIADGGEATRTQGSMVGTLKYMSPEQVTGTKVDSRTDLFAAGVMLYQLLTGTKPFEGDSDFAIMQAIAQKDPPPPSSLNHRLPEGTDAVVAKALAKNRDHRYASAKDFALALRAVTQRAAEGGGSAPPPGAHAPPYAAPQATAPAPGSQGAPGPATNTGGSRASGTTSSSTSAVSQEMELLYWKDIQDSADPEDFQDFLQQFPEGAFAKRAQGRLRKLASAASERTGSQSVASSPDVSALRAELSEAKSEAPSAPSVLPPAPGPEPTSDAEEPTRPPTRTTPSVDSKGVDRAAREAAARRAAEEAARRQVEEARRKAEEARRAEQARVVAEAQKAEEARRAREQKAQEEARQAELAKEAEAKRKEKEAEEERQAEELRKAQAAEAAERARQAEEERLAAQAREVEKARKLEAERAAREAQAAEERQRVEEEHKARQAKELAQAEAARKAAQAALEAKRQQEAEALRQAEVARRLEAERQARKALEEQRAREAEEEARKQAELAQKRKDEAAVELARKAKLESEAKKEQQAREQREAEAERKTKEQEADKQRAEQAQRLKRAEADEALRKAEAKRIEEEAHKAEQARRAAELKKPDPTQALPSGRHEPKGPTITAPERGDDDPTTVGPTHALAVPAKPAEPKVPDDDNAAAGAASINALLREPVAAPKPAAPTPAVPPQAAPAQSGNKGRLIAVAAAIALVGGGGAWFAMRDGEKKPAAPTPLPTAPTEPPKPPNVPPVAPEKPPVVVAPPPSEQTPTVPVPPQPPASPPPQDSNTAMAQAKALERSDLRAAVAAYEKIANSADKKAASDAARNLWEIYRDGGKGLQPNSEQAQRWYERARKMGVKLPAWTAEKPASAPASAALSTAPPPAPAIPSPPPVPVPPPGATPVPPATLPPAPAPTASAPPPVQLPVPTPPPAPAAAKTPAELFAQGQSLEGGKSERLMLNAYREAAKQGHGPSQKRLWELLKEKSDEASKREAADYQKKAWDQKVDGVPKPPDAIRL